MIKNIKHIIAAASAVLLLGSCQDFLNTPPEGSLPSEGYYTTATHIEQGVRGAYRLLMDVELPHYITFGEDRSDNVWVDPAPNGVRTCSESSYWRITSTTDELEDLWAGWYEVINNANTVLEQLDNVTFNDESIKNQFKGELLFLRGYAHFELARSFANVPAVDHVLTLSEASVLGQSTPSEVINDRVLPDLQEAEELLPYEDGMTNSEGTTIWGEGRADKIVAKAMLARVYMTLKGYPFNDATAAQNARTYLDEVLAYSSENGDKYWAPTITEWKKQWMTDSDVSNTYQIFAIQHTLSAGNNVSGNSGYGLSDEFFPNGGSYTAYTNGSSMTPVAPEAYLRYEYVVHNDPRGLDFAFIDYYDAYGGTNAYSNQTIEIEYEGQTVTSYELSINTKWIPYASKREEVGISFDDTGLTSSGWPVNFPIIRLEDMMLLRAELYAEDGDVASAMELVNKIRQRAGITLRETNPSSDQAMEYIKMERKLELYLEGVRWFDQVRYGEWEETTLEKYQRYMIDGAYRTGVSDSNVYGERYTLPIPFDELAAVPGLYVQNEDWN